MQDAFSEYEDSEKLTLKLMTEISKTAKELGVNEKSIPSYSNLSNVIEGKSLPDGLSIDQKIYK